MRAVDARLQNADFISICGSDEEIVPVWFYASRYDHEEHLYLPFLASLLRDDRIAKTTVQKEKLMEAARAFLYGLAIKTKWLEFSAKDAIEHEQELAKTGQSGIVQLTTGYVDIPSNLETLTNGAEERKGRRRRIVVFVDDLDRCVSSKAFSLLESIKAFTDIPGFVFVFGLDPRAVAVYVHEKYKDGLHVTADEYLQKLIQVPFCLPRADSNHFEDYLRTLVTERRAIWSDSMIEMIMEFAPRNVRQTKRIINMHGVLQGTIPACSPELLLALLLLQVRWPVAYDVLHAMGAGFHDFMSSASTDEENRKPPYREHPAMRTVSGDPDIGRFYTQAMCKACGGDPRRYVPYLDHMGHPVGTVRPEGKTNG